MRIKDILSTESMIMDLKATNKEDAIKEMADLEVKTGIVNNEDEFIKSIWARENEFNHWYRWRNCDASRT